MFSRLRKARKSAADNYSALSLNLTAAENRMLSSVADEAVMKFENDSDAIRYLNKEVLQRCPKIWFAVMAQTYFPNYPQ